MEPQGDLARAWFSGNITRFEEAVGAWGQRESTGRPDAPDFTHQMSLEALKSAFRNALLRSDSTAEAIIRGVQVATEGYSLIDRLVAYEELERIMRVAFSGGKGHCPLSRADRAKLRQHIWSSIAQATAPKLVIK